MTQDYGTAQSDGDAWAKTLLLRLGTAFSSLLNEFAQCIQFICQPTSAKASYEKCGLIVEGLNADPSDYPGGITKDAIAVNGTCTITGGIQTGRVWGLYGQAGCLAGSDGMLVGIELGLDNQGSDQPLLDTPTSKVVQSLVAGEGDPATSKPITALQTMSAGNSKAHMGSVAYQTAFVDPRAPAYATRDQQGNISSYIGADGSFVPKQLYIPFINSDTMPAVTPGTAIIWGDTKDGIIYLVFHNGAAALKIPFKA